MNDVHEGGCQCGTIRYRVRGDPVTVGICHCKECQRQSGSAFGMTFVVRKEAFELLNGRPKTFTRTSESGRPVLCAFCPECGTRIYHEARWREGVVNVKPGTLDDTSILQPTAQVWTSRKQSWLELPGIQAFAAQPF